MCPSGPSKATQWSPPWLMLVVQPPRALVPLSTPTLRELAGSRSNQVWRTTAALAPEPCSRWLTADSVAAPRPARNACRTWVASCTPGSLWEPHRAHLPGRTARGERHCWHPRLRPCAQVPAPPPPLGRAARGAQPRGEQHRRAPRNAAAGGEGGSALPAAAAGAGARAWLARRHPYRRGWRHAARGAGEAARRPHGCI